MKKQEIIQEAYGEYWQNLKDSVDENGYANLDNSFNYEDIGLELQDNNNWRPKSLQGIESNNGWIKIESIEDLPELKDDLLIFRNKEGFTTTWQSDDIKSTPNYFLRYSHWRLKDKILDPLF